MGKDPLGNIARINHALESLPKRLAEAKTKLENIERQLETAKVEVTKPFAQGIELAEKLERLSALNALLNMDEKGDDAIVMEDVPDENEVQETSGHDGQKLKREESAFEKSKVEEKGSDMPLQKFSLKEKLKAYKARVDGGDADKIMPQKAKGKEETL